MFQDEGDVTRAVEVRDHLDVIAQTVVGQLLQLGGGERLRLYQRGRTLIFEMSFQLDCEAVDLEKRGLADGLLQSVGPIEVMGIIPVNLAELKVWPILNLPLGERQCTGARPQQLHEGDYSIEKPGRGVRCG